MELHIFRRNAAQDDPVVPACKETSRVLERPPDTAPSLRDFVAHSPMQRPACCGGNAPPAPQRERAVVTGYGLALQESRGFPRQFTSCFTSFCRFPQTLGNDRAMWRRLKSAVLSQEIPLAQSGIVGQAWRAPRLPVCHAWAGPGHPRRPRARCEELYDALIEAGASEEKRGSPPVL